MSLDKITLNICLQTVRGQRFSLIVILVFLTLFWTSSVGAVVRNVPGDFGSIQDAINGSDVNDTIIVERGTYNEVLIVNKNGLTIRGRETAQTFIDPGSANTAISIDGLSNVTIANFTFINAKTGVSVSGINNTISIENNVFDVGTANTGVEIVNTFLGGIIDNNTFHRNNTAVLSSLTDANIRNNIFFGNSTAIQTIDNPQNVTFNCFFGNADNGSVGANEVTGNPLLVNPGARDFHLQTNSPCIDEGTGTDIIDGTVADIGAYGGNLADKFPFPTPQPSATDTSPSPSGPFSINMSWAANTAYLVAGYDVYYGTAPGVYNGADAAEGTSPIPAGNVTGFSLTNLSPSPGTPSTPTLISVAPSNQTLSLEWSAAAQASSYRVLYGVASVNENTINVGNVTKYDLGGLENGTTYLVSIQAIAQQTYYLATKVYDNTGNRNTSTFSAEQSIAIGPTNESALSNTMSGLPEAVLAFPNLPNEGCFIATAAYGADHAPELTILREFRDEVLLTNRAGHLLVAMYYRYSPPVAAVIADYPWLKALVRALLLPIVIVAVFILQASTIPKLLVTTLFLILVWRFTSRLIARIRNLRRGHLLKAT